MTTSASTTFSPSRRSTTRSTPCVLGCCGPMLITSSLVSNMAPWWTVGVSMSPFVRRSTFAVRRSNEARRTANVERCLFDIRLFACLFQLQPIDGILHQQLARTFERIVLALRESLPVLRHQDAAAIGMSGEVDAEHVVDL